VPKKRLLFILRSFLAAWFQGSRRNTALFALNLSD
jgi:hypothetical protein